MNSQQRTIWVEVTNTLAVDYVTGFQRHTRELLARLPGPQDTGPLRFIPMVWCQECDGFRRLTSEETSALARFVRPTSPATSGVERIASRLGFAGDAFRRFANSQSARRARDLLAARRRQLHHPAEHRALRIDVWPPDSWLFDLEAAWHNRERSYVLQRMKSEGLRTSTLVADVMPVQFPEWFDDGQIGLFKRFIDAHLEHSEKFVCISKASQRDVIDYAKVQHPSRRLETSLITMGANFERPDDVVERPASAPAGRYGICVATIEPRKNHRLLLDAFNRLNRTNQSENPAADASDFSIVMVGKAGWMTESLIEEIRAHPEFGKRLRWLDNVDDVELDALFAHAFIAIQPAYYEGFGTPVIEALSHGIPTLASNGGALTEAGGGYAEYFEPSSTDELVGLIERHLTDEHHHTKLRSRLDNYHPPTWEDGAEGIIAAFSTSESSTPELSDPG